MSTLTIANKLGFGWEQSSKSLAERFMPAQVADGSLKLHNMLRDAVQRKLYWTILNKRAEIDAQSTITKTSYGYWLERYPKEVAELLGEDTPVEGVELPPYEVFEAEMLQIIDDLDNREPQGQQVIRRRR